MADKKKGYWGVVYFSDKEEDKNADWVEKVYCSKDCGWVYPKAEELLAEGHGPCDTIEEALEIVEYLNCYSWIFGKATRLCAVEA
jgi:hypothetical protein